MQSYWVTVVNQKQRYEDLVRETQNERLARSAQMKPALRTSLRRRTLGWLGCRLVAWGLRLQGNQAAAAQLTTC